MDVRLLARLLAGSVGLGLLAPATGCKGKQEPSMPSSWANFDCKDRKATYQVANSMAADEAGVQIDCQTGPRVVRWVVDKDGTRLEDSQAISPGEFEDVWQRIDSIGWHHLGDCPPDQGKDIPIYTFDVADWNEAKTFQCEALRPPFPWITVVDELDQLAASIRGDRGKNTIDVDDPAPATPGARSE